jgi:hypothetical protein
MEKKELLVVFSKRKGRTWLGEVAAVIGGWFELVGEKV